MSLRHSILVVDDEPQILRFLGHALEGAGYDCLTSSNGRSALAIVKSKSPDLVILDLGLPDMDGKLVAGSIRQFSQVPILVLSARDQEQEKIAALDLGANDFVVKPFGIGELLARIRALMRDYKQKTINANPMNLGPVTIDRDRHEVQVSGVLVHLTPKEFDLLVLLASNRNKVLTSKFMLEKVWGPAHRDDIAYLRVLIGQLRQKIEAEPSKPKFIQTEQGVGYRFEIDN